jgi:hypothetical protein
MYFFHESLVLHALETFKHHDFTDPDQGDRFFGVFAPGNTTFYPDRPYERFCDYEELLFRLMETDQAKYRIMHKGTPFGFLSCLAFDLRNYEKALFYMDAGIGEDVRKHKDQRDPAGWLRNPGPRFLLLDHWLKRTYTDVKSLLEKELSGFNAISGRAPIDIEFWRRFARALLVDPDPTLRAMISAMYVFLLEFRDNYRELLLREGSTGGSNQPFTVHLFTGGLIFESLLKHWYPNNGQGKKNRTIGDILDKRISPAFAADFGDGCAAVRRGADTLEEIHNAIQDSSIETAFGTAVRLRNTTGHNIVWDDIFNTPRKYTDLFTQLTSAILHVICRKFV